MPLVCKEEKVSYNLYLASTSLHLWRSMLDGDKQQNFIRQRDKLGCFEYLFPLAWIPTRGDHFLMLWDFKHSFQERTSSLLISVSWHFAETYFILRQNRARSDDFVHSPQWHEQETHRALHKPTSPVFFCYSNWVLKASVRHLISTVARGNFAVSAVDQLIQVATKCLFFFNSVDERVLPEKFFILRSVFQFSCPLPS